MEDLDETLKENPNSVTNNDFNSLEQELGQIDSNIQGSVHMKPGKPGTEPAIKILGLDKKLSVLAILGLIFSFLPPVGIILSIIALFIIKANKRDIKGKGLATFAIFMAIFFLIFELIFIFGVSFSGPDGVCEIEGPFECSRVTIKGKSLLIEIEGKLSAGSFLQNDPQITIEGQRCTDVIVPGDPTEEKIWVTCKLPDNLVDDSNLKEGVIVLDYYQADTQSFETTQGKLSV